MLELSELEHDALTEISNVAIGRSAGVLNEMISQEVILTVPSIAIIKRSEIPANVDGLSVNDLTIVQQGFDGPLSGLASIAFPEDKSLELVRLLLDEDMSSEEILDLEQEALQEMGNVIMNSFLGTLGNEFGVNIATEIPKFHKNVDIDLLYGPSEVEETSVIFIHVDFNIENENINGYLVLSVSVPTVEKIRNLITQYLENLI